MFDSLFGSELPLAARFFIAFLVVLVLIGATAYVIRRFGAGRLGAVMNRGRQPRLGVIDAANVDGRRRLVLIRRDNVEHLLLIGGPSDVVVESNIVRAVPVAPAREMSVGRASGIPDNLAQRPAEANQWMPEGEPMPRIVRAPEAGRSQPEARLLDIEPPLTRGFEDDMIPRAASSDSPNMNGQLPRVEPPLALRAEPVAPRMAVETRQPDPNPDAEANLTDMAQRLEAALRRPLTPAEARQAKQSAQPEQVREPTPAREQPRKEPPRVEPPRAAPEPTLRPVAAVEKRPTRGEPASKGPTVFDSLEDEMASLLGRSSAKDK